MIVHVNRKHLCVSIQKRIADRFNFRHPRGQGFTLEIVPKYGAAVGQASDNISAVEGRKSAFSSLIQTPVIIIP